jgi:hypothetical protein
VVPASVSGNADPALLLEPGEHLLLVLAGCLDKRRDRSIRKAVHERRGELRDDDLLSRRELRTG